LQQAIGASELEAQACKQEEKLLQQLEKMTKMITASGYKIKAPQHVQEAHLLKVRVLTISSSHFSSFINKRIGMNVRTHRILKS
jgi:hypothetical protein